MVLGREIENKYVILRSSLASAKMILDLLYTDTPVESGAGAIDMFWSSEGVDFVRLRENTLELTVKISDKGIVTDRIEENVKVLDWDSAVRFANATFGPSVGQLKKTYHVYFLDGYIISLYQVEDHPEVFLEVEGTDAEVVGKIGEDFGKLFNLRQEHRSLYQIIFGGDK